LPHTRQSLGAGTTHGSEDCKDNAGGHDNPCPIAYTTTTCALDRTPTPPPHGLNMVHCDCAVSRDVSTTQSTGGSDDGVTVRVGVILGVTDGIVTLGVTEGVEDNDFDSVMELVTEMVGVTDGDILREDVGVPVGVIEGVTETDDDLEIEDVTDAVIDLDDVTLDVLDSLQLAVTLLDCVGVRVNDRDVVDVRDPDGVTESVDVDDSDTLDDSDRLSVALLEAELDPVPEGVGEYVGVMDGVRERDMEILAVGDRDDVAVSVAVGDADSDVHCHNCWPPPSSAIMYKSSECAVRKEGEEPIGPILKSTSNTKSSNWEYEKSSKPVSGVRATKYSLKLNNARACG
jgi:hypothetical protein